MCHVRFSLATRKPFGATIRTRLLLREKVTEAVGQAFFSPLGVTKVTRYEVPNLEAMNSVLESVLAEGGSRSLRIDAQGKALGQAMLELTI